MDGRRWQRLADVVVVVGRRAAVEVVEVEAVAAYRECDRQPSQRSDDGDGDGDGRTGVRRMGGGRCRPWGAGGGSGNGKRAGPAEEKAAG